MRNLSSKRFRDKMRNCVAYLVRGVLLQKVRSLNGNLVLIRPSAAEFPLRPNQESGRICVDKQLRYSIG
jgi:hypothetical protein